ncbi:MAG: hypothetical protein AB7O98_07270 [Hyphomonadaceae bacterium]
MRALFLAALLLAYGCSGSAAEHSTAARGLIEQSGVGEAFEDASTAQFAAVRHKSSGLVCRLPAEGAFHIEVFPPNVANEGAACSHASGSVAETLLAVRFSRAVTFERAFTEAVAMSAPQSARRWREAPVENNATTRDERVSRLQGEMNGQPYFARVAMRQGEDGWLLQQIVLAPLELASEADSTADERWREAVGGER